MAICQRVLEVLGIGYSRVIQSAYSFLLKITELHRVTYARYKQNNADDRGKFKTVFYTILFFVPTVPTAFIFM